MPLIGPKMTQNGPKWHKYDPKWPKNAQNSPRMTKNGPKLTRTFSAIFLTEKAVPQTFSLLECMVKRFKKMYFFSNIICYIFKQSMRVV